MNIRLAAPAFAAGIAFLLVACGTTAAPPAVVDSPAAGSNRPSSSSTSASPTETPSPSSTTTDTSQAKFGEAYKWTDGLQVKVGAPTNYKPSNSAYVPDPKPPAFIKMEFTVVNGSKEPFDPVGFYVTVQSGNVEAKQVFDSGGGMAGSPSTKILPGREAKFSLAFGVTDPKDLVVQVRPGFKYNDAIWTS
jgi:hypothetical protein